MAKLDVGIGDEFPIDEGKPREDGPREGKAEASGEERGGKDSGGECGGRDWREHRAEWRRRWRDRPEWHGRGHTHYWRNNHARQLLAALFIIGAIALLIAIISHFFYFILGAAVLAALYISHGRDHGDWNFHPRRRSEQN